ncbi:MFS transporter [Paenibacillus bovis]|uniref:MFS transporter n=1 Tax=Paenibacillus bovis TaxID=1616788 RepID=A0A172ZH78_9BACL|nr:MFS transporter [Paenibacillus bovis]ANF96994.1 MFS transporter [Paenibacillus bovis]
MSKRSWWLMISIGLGIMLNPLNSSMVAVAIPNLQHTFQLNYTAVSWIIFAFYIASAVTQPVMGRASDLFGRRKIFLAGLLVSFIVSLCAPLSISFGWLIVFRIVQSIGTSMMVAVGMAIVRIHITEKQSTALSVLSIFLSGAAAIGPFIGGLLMYWWDWRAIFLGNIPFVIASMLLAWKVIPDDKASIPKADRLTLGKWMIRIDAAGIFLFTLGLVALLLGVLSAQSSHSLSVYSFTVGLAGIILLAAFIWHERRAASPFIPLRIFARHPAMTWVNIEFVVVNLIFYAVFFGLPSYLQIVRHISELNTGILMLSLGICSLLVSPVAGRWIDRSGPGPALLFSAMFMTLGSIGLVALGPDSGMIGICMALGAFGISNGLNNVGMQAALFAASPKEIIGVASGLFSTSRYIGTILSSLLISIVAGTQFTFAGFRLLGVILTIAAVLLVCMQWQRYKRHQHISSDTLS